MNIQQEAKYRVELKRELRAKGIKYNSSEPTTKLEALLSGEYVDMPTLSESDSKANYLHSMMTLPLNKDLGGLPLRCALTMFKQFVGMTYTHDIYQHELDDFMMWVCDLGYPVVYLIDRQVSVILPRK